MHERKLYRHIEWYVTCLAMACGLVLRPPWNITTRMPNQLTFLPLYQAGFELKQLDSSNVYLWCDDHSSAGWVHRQAWNTYFTNSTMHDISHNAPFCEWSGHTCSHFCHKMVRDTGLLVFTVLYQMVLGHQQAQSLLHTHIWLLIMTYNFYAANDAILYASYSLELHKLAVKINHFYVKYCLYQQYARAYISPMRTCVADAHAYLFDRALI